MNKKVAIITLYGNNNYGNKLQNYALQEYLKKYFSIVETLINYPLTNKEHRYYLRNIKNKVKSILKPIRDHVNKNRLKCFLDFNNNICYNNKILTIKNAKKFNYDYFVVGSDQVWNYHYALNDVELLNFVPNNKRISYAASFGFLDIPDNYKKNMINELNKFNSISVREEEGKKLLDNLNINKNVTVSIDPTFLLSVDEWNKVLKKPSFEIPEKYVLLYFLGDLDNKIYLLIEKFSKDNNCQIISLLDVNSKYYETGPSEFLYLIKNSFAVFTDSFHSSVFSIIYNKPFMIFDRIETGINSKSNMNSRINTLVKKFNLNNRFCGKIEYNDMIFNYNETQEIINSEILKTDEYFINALKK